ncbi:MAG TPA: BMP family ABC transporter substrate-binding protein [bacterium]|nr:BMP family ABC transporter substrate-binding protein [bacterium]
MKRAIVPVVAACLGLAVALSGCGGDKQAAKGTSPRASQASKIKVALVLSVGGLGDKSFNDSAYQGLMKAKDQLGITAVYGQPEQMAEDEKYLRQYAEQGFDLVIGVGFLMKDALDKVAGEFPQTHFAIIDAVVTRPNVASLVFREHEGSFLVGAIAGLMSKTGKVGFVGGMDIPLIHKFEVGYTEGVKYVNPKAEVLVAYAGSGPEAFHDPVKGKSLALNQFDRGADVIFQAAGSTGNGVIDAAKERNLFAIGVDANQNYMAPGHVLTSMVKHVDVAVFQIIKDVVDGKSIGGPHVYGPEVDGVGYALDDYNRSLIPPDVLAKVEAIKRDIVAGKIKVTDYTAIH